MNPIHIPALRLGLVGALAIALATLGPAAADAACSKTRPVEIGSGKTKNVPRVGKPERKFGGKVLTGEKRFSTWARSVDKYIGSINKNRKDKFWEDKAEKTWKVHYIAFFKAPHDDVEVTIRIYDLTKGEKQMLSSFEQFIDRCATSYASDVVLKRERFGVNKQLLITVESSRGRKVLAAGKFKILGEAEKFTGKADFSDEIAPAPERDEDAIAAAQRANNERANAEKDELPPEVEETPIDYESNKYEKTPDLDHQDGMDNAAGPGEPKSNRGCGCHHGGPEDMAVGALFIVGAFFLFRRRRERGRKPGSDR